MSNDKPHILVIDDDDRLRSLLSKYLREQEFLVTSAASAEEARAKMAVFVFDLLVLDVMMPNETGFEFLASHKGEHIPTLMLSAMGETDDRIKGLELGAEDYLIKPFEPKELVLRIRAILRRVGAQEEKSNIVQFGEYRFDLQALQLKRGEEIVHLTSSEAQILKLLANQAGSPVSREEISAQITGGGNERSIDVQMLRLRKKIEENDSKPLHIQTVRGAGYVLYAQKAGSV
jgi:two-component system phosphate regulon response regulator OmpR